MSLSSTFTGTGASTAIQVGKEPTAVSINGITTATIELQRQTIAGTWAAVKEYTADAEEVLEGGRPGQYRFECTAWTSGTVVCELGG